MTRRQTDEGAYAVLYAIVVVLLVGMAALVVDLASLRADKRDGRTAADLAALAGAADLGTGPYAPRQACDDAWANALLNLGVSAPASPCGSFAAPNWPVSVASCPNAPYPPATATANGVTITIRWPIPSTDAALTSPDGLQEGGSRTYDAAFDGTTAGCDRLGVEVQKTRSLALGSAVGYSSGVTEARSVARFSQKPGNADYPYPLVLLDQHNCVTLAVNGGTTVIVTNNGETPGRIGVDSDGTTGCSGGPATSNGVILDAGGTGSTLQALAGSAGAVASIEVYGPSGLPTNTAIPGKVHNCSSGTPCIDPAPVRRTARITRAKLDQVYDCDGTSKCPTGSASQAYVSRFVSAAGAVTATTPGWTVINNSSVPACNSSAAVLTGTQFFINCGGSWTVNGNWIFPAGATVVVNGTLSVKGCFAMNIDPLLVPNPCPVLPPGSTYTPIVTTNLATNALLSVRGGIQSNGSAGLLVLPRTFVNQPLTSNRFDGSGFQVIDWTAPYGDKDALAAQCAAVTTGMPPVACFRNLALWTEANAGDSDPEKITGGSGLHLEGTFFMGNSKLKLSGGSGIDVASSQFVVKRIEAFGGSTLTFTPNPDRTNGFPQSGVSLIR